MGWLEAGLGALGSLFGAKAASEAGEAPYTVDELLAIALANSKMQSPNLYGPFGSVTTTFGQDGQPTTTTQVPEWMQGLIDRTAGRAANPDQYTPNPATYAMRSDRWARRGYPGAPTGPQSLPQAMVDVGMVGGSQGNFNQPPAAGNPGVVGSRPGSEAPGAGSGGSVGVGGRGGGVGQGGGMGPGGEGRGEIGDRGGWGSPGRNPAEWGWEEFGEWWANHPDWVQRATNAGLDDLVGAIAGPLGNFGTDFAVSELNDRFPSGVMHPDSPNFATPGGSPPPENAWSPSDHVPDYIGGNYDTQSRRPGESIGGYIARVSTPSNTAYHINSAIYGPAAAAGIRGGVGAAGIPVGIGTSLGSLRAQMGRYGSGKRGSTALLEGFQSEEQVE